MDIQPAIFVRYVKHGELIEDLVDEGKAGTFVLGAEHLLLKLATGERVMVRGGRDGIVFDIQENADGTRALSMKIHGQDTAVARIYGHTHPRVTGPSDGDLEALEVLDQTKSYLIELGGGGHFGTIIRPKPRRPRR